MQKALIVCGMVALATPTLAATLDPAFGRLILGSPDSDARVEFFDGGFTLFGSDSGAGTRSVDRFEFDVIAPPFAAPTVSYDLDNIELTLVPFGIRGGEGGAGPMLPTFKAGELAQPFLDGRSLTDPLRFDVNRFYHVSARVPYEITYDRFVLSYSTEYGTEDVHLFFDTPNCAFGCSDQTLHFESITSRPIQIPRDVLPNNNVSDTIPPDMRRILSAAEWRPESFDDLRQALLDPEREVELDWVVNQSFDAMLVSIRDYVEPLFQTGFDDGVRQSFAPSDLLALIFAEIDSLDQMGGAAWLTFSDIDLRIEQVTRSGVLTLSTVPVPPAMAGMLAGMGLLGWIARRKRLARAG